jgi:hypothetical protein
MCRAKNYQNRSMGSRSGHRVSIPWKAGLILTLSKIHQGVPRLKGLAIANAIKHTKAGYAQRQGLKGQRRNDSRKD